MKASHMGLFDWGRDAWEGTRQYEDLVKKAVKEVRDKYSPLLVNEKNLLRRLVISVRQQMVLEKRIRQLSSPKNLHVTRDGAFY